MAPKKLSDAEKQDIVSLYREPAETTTTLSERFGVSSSTISRILKGALSKAEYDVLVQQKRAKGSSASVNDVSDTSDAPSDAIDVSDALDMSDAPSDAPSDSTSGQTNPILSGKTDSGKPMPITKSAKSSRTAAVDLTAIDSPMVESTATDAEGVDATAVDSPAELASPELASGETDRDAQPAIADQSSQEADSDEESSRRSRKRTSAKPVTKSDKIRAQAEQAVAEKIGQQLQLLDASFREDPPIVDTDVVTEAVNVPTLETPQSYTANDLDEEEDDDFDDELDDDLDDIDDLDDDFDDDDDDDDDYGENLLDSTSASDRILIEVLPFEDAELPRTCYLVVDRFAELITRPLREFGHLGQIPETEVQEITLPVFDNHRVARRFSRRNQRVIKVPDGNMLEKTSDYLQAKGITRLLIDGQIYALD